MSISSHSSEVTPLQPNSCSSLLRKVQLTTDGLLERGREGTWTVSTSKPGNGVRQLRDDDLNTVWQSDGIGPHCATVYFSKRTPLSRVDLFVDQRIDESYTPHLISIRVGNTEADLERVASVKFDDPRGWQSVMLKSNQYNDISKSESDGGHSTDGTKSETRADSTPEGINDDEKRLAVSSDGDHKVADNDDQAKQICVFGFCLQVVILQNYQHGQDCHIRQIKVYGPP